MNLHTGVCVFFETGIIDSGGIFKKPTLTLGHHSAHGQVVHRFDGGTQAFTKLLPRIPLTPSTPAPIQMIY